MDLLIIENLLVLLINDFFVKLCFTRALVPVQFTLEFVRVTLLNASFQKEKKKSAKPNHIRLPYLYRKQRLNTC